MIYLMLLNVLRTCLNLESVGQAAFQRPIANLLAYVSLSRKQENEHYEYRPEWN